MRKWPSVVVAKPGHTSDAHRPDGVRAPTRTFIHIFSLSFHLCRSDSVSRHGCVRLLALSSWWLSVVAATATTMAVCLFVCLPSRVLYRCSSSGASNRLSLRAQFAIVSPIRGSSASRNPGQVCATLSASRREEAEIAIGRRQKIHIIILILIRMMTNFNLSDRPSL